ncbi:FAD-binding and (Fe-S)-binding domain-containing protein [Isoptericola sp. b408]|uniref:FAD-binding and (Fe-S)-binding domain-containing protein n=1 Tax=Isoptericola sp. b408 TaxID=3064653 RepID=UPI00271434D9|nr:FAD-binding and (Fe-S)-binding domain-containing protein [Isoptericola sp. b408]MDO8152200.1 FAD-binding and (Fe-S)-binding domain-containing protein [Isoptericola sp. b408]
MDGTVDSSTRRRAEYSTDASNYRVVPDLVVFPRSTDEVVAALDVLRELEVPVTARGAGTSVAGNSVGPGVVLDLSQHLDTIHAVDPTARTADVEPGVIMSSLQHAARPHGLRFGPDPSTQNRATLGGMIGNNACGPHAVAYGRTADNVVALDVVDGHGRRFTAGRGDAGFAAVPGLAELVRENLALIRTEFGRFGRQVSGYSLEHLLPENGSDLAKFLVGTEGTLVTVLGATLDLVPLPNAPTLVVLGYPDMPSAADDVPVLLEHDPLAIEGLDARLVDVVRRAKGAGAVPELPEGAGWLMIEVGGGSENEVRELAEMIVGASSAVGAAVYPAGPEATRMWQIRADGAGLAGRTPAGEQAWPGWEDSAVPPENLGAYLRDLDALMARYGVDGLPYGHFGDGCLHLRIDIPLEASGSVLRTFMTEAAQLVARYGGSLSGEHGDGRARSELLPLIYSPEAVALMEQVKALFDPRDVLNPGVVVRPAAVDADLRRPAASPVPSTGPVGRNGLLGSGTLRGISRKTGHAGFSFTHDHDDLTAAVHRCVGVGKCRADNEASGGFMCPSYQATRDEKDVTRGRARVLQEAVNGSLVGGLTAPEVRESLDLCLSCKACSSDCPAGVDMAQYKSEVLHRTYKGRPRPVDHYALGWLPRWARLAGIAPRTINRLLSVDWIRRPVLWAGGMDTRRQVPEFAEMSFRRWWRLGYATRGVPGLPHRQEPGRLVESDRPKVVLWTDSFSDSMSPSVPQAAVRVLEAAGYEVVVPTSAACCGLTWISTGQLDGARRRLDGLLKTLGPYAVNGYPILGLEPSCTAVLRSDLLDLFPDDPRAHAVAGATRTLAELLTDPATAPAEDSGWELPDLSDVTAVVQPHCHQHSVMGFAADRALLAQAGATVTELAGCCGLAGNFGMQKGHYDVSVAVAENALLPALRAQEEGEEFIADGFSCRTQAVQLEGVEGKALVEVLAARL